MRPQGAVWKGPPRPVPGQAELHILVLNLSLRDSQVLCCPWPAGGRRALPRSWNWYGAEGKQTKRKPSRTFLDWGGVGASDPTALRESEAAAAQLCSPAAGQRVPGIRRGPLILCITRCTAERGYGQMWQRAVQAPGWTLGGPYGKGQVSSQLFMPWTWILKLTWVMVGVGGGNK